MIPCTRLRVAESQRQPQRAVSELGRQPLEPELQLARQRLQRQRLSRGLYLQV